MTVRMEEIIRAWSPERQKRVAARAKQLIAEEMSLRELRQANQVTQVRLAKTLGVGQEQVSRVEKRNDLLLSTLRNYVEAMGGKLQLVAKFPDRKPVTLSGVAGVERLRRSRAAS